MALYILFVYEAKMRVFESQVEETHCRLSGQISSMKLAVSIHQTGVTDSNGDLDVGITIGTGGVSERG